MRSLGIVFFKVVSEASEMRQILRLCRCVSQPSLCNEMPSYDYRCSGSVSQE